MKVPDEDCCALFTSEETAGNYIQACENIGVIKAGDMQPVPVLHRWQRSVFQTLAEHFNDGGVVDPIPMSGQGLRLDREAIEAALEQVDTMLKPRVRGFVAGG